MHVRDVLSGKSSLVHTCSPDDTLADVADLLVGHNIGSLIVMHEEEMIGIITERDILRACAATRGPLEFLKVSERMTRCPVAVSPSDEVTDVMCIMTERRIRHVPVVEAGRHQDGGQRVRVFGRIAAQDLESERLHGASARFQDFHCLRIVPVVNDGAHEVSVGT